MEELLITIIGGIFVTIVATWFGIGGKTKVIVQGTKSRKTGKWIILISIVMIIGGLAWAGYNSPPEGGFDFDRPGTIYGFTLAGYGVLFFIVGKIIAWFQRL